MQLGNGTIVGSLGRMSNKVLGCREGVRLHVVDLLKNNALINPVFWSVAVYLSLPR
jgi:hypothetical protein